MKKIALGNLGEFWYGDYKEPFEQLEGGVPGHPVGVVLKDDAGKVLCAFCGKTYDNLGKHAEMKHGLPAREYKQEVGLLQKTALVSERVRLSHIAHAARRGTATQWSKKSLPTRTPASIRTGDQNGMRAPELRNKRGTCYTQLLTAARSIVTQRGRVTLRDLAKIGIHPVTIRQYFPTLDDFFREVGSASTLRGSAKSNAELLRVLRNVATTLGRLPTRSDFARLGLPEQAIYRRRFGSWVAACQHAGLDPYLPQPDGTDFAVSVLTAYAVHGSMARTAAHLHVGLDRIEKVFATYGAPFAPNTPHGRSSAERRAWAAEMSRRLAGTPEPVAA